MRRLMIAGILAAATVGTTGCLDKQTTHSIHLSPEGTVNWVAIEREVRSDDADPEARAREEGEYLSMVRLGTHPIAQAFGLLAPTAVRTQTYRDERPFLVLTEARFERIDWLGHRVLERIGLPGASRLERADGEMCWTLMADLTAETDDDAGDDLLPLVEDLEAYRVILTDGRFTAATGFEILDDGAAARFVEPPDDEPAPGRLVLSLTWTTGRPSVRRAPVRQVQQRHPMHAIRRAAR